MISNLFTKQSEARIALSINKVGQPITSPKNYEGFSREGYAKNVIAYRCISMIAKACAGIKWEVYQKSRTGEGIEQPMSPLLTLINRPNPLQGRSAFFESLISYFVMTGNSYIESVSPSDRFPPMELWTMRPDKIRIIPGPDGYPQRYEFSANNIVKKWDMNPITFQCGILQMKTFNPLDEWFGMSPLEAAMLSLDQNNQGNKWNLALLQNSATPSGVIKVKTSDVNPSGSLSDEQYEKLKESLAENYQGSRNTGRPMLLEGGLEWQPMGFSPVDMNFIQSKSVSGQDIAIAFGVPGEILGLGTKTFANYKEARLSFYEETILPIMDFVQTELNNWLAPRFGEGIYLEYDKDDIEALTEKRDQKYTSLQNTNWLTQNEKREAIGYEPVEGWDVFVINNQAVEMPKDLSVGSNFSSQNTQLNAPLPKKPASGINLENTDETSPPPPETIEESSDPRGLEIKQVNLINQKEKITAWNKLNRKRATYISSFSKDLREDLLEMSSKLREAGQNKPPKLAEYAMLKAIDEFMPTIRKTLERHISYVVKDFGNDFFNQYKKIGIDTETKKVKTWDFWAKEYIKTRSGNSISEIQGATTKKVQSVVKRLVESAVVEGASDYDISKDLEDHFDGLSKSRAITIARTETGMASNNATLEAAKSLEIPNLEKEWVSVQDLRTRDGGKTGDDANHLDMNGIRVPLDEKFLVPPDTSMDGPGDEAGGASQVINCRCVLVFNSSRGE
jgi:HK97 family phage portal protein